MASFLSGKIGSRAKGRESFDIRLTGGGQRRDDVSSSLVHHATAQSFCAICV
jgi:hypothetical protein